MKIDISVGFDFGMGSDNVCFENVVDQFSFLIRESNELLRDNQEWCETGYSKKQALSHLAFKDGKISNDVFSKWERRYKKDYPLFVEGVWDGKGDYSSGISYRKMYYDEVDRVNVELNLVSENENIGVDDFIRLLSNLAQYFSCSYINVEGKGYRFFDKNVFPDRLSVGWMLYSPSIVLPELIPEAARVIPVMDGNKQKGTIIVSTEDVFDGGNKEHIGKSNDIEIKLLDLGFLPLLTEL